MSRSSRWVRGITATSRCSSRRCSTGSRSLDERRRSAPRDHGLARTAGRNEVGAFRARCTRPCSTRPMPSRSRAPRRLPIRRTGLPPARTLLRSTSWYIERLTALVGRNRLLLRPLGERRCEYDVETRVPGAAQPREPRCRDCRRRSSSARLRRGHDCGDSRRSNYLRADTIASCLAGRPARHLRCVQCQRERHDRGARRVRRRERLRGASRCSPAWRSLARKRRAARTRRRARGRDESTCCWSAAILPAALARGARRAGLAAARIVSGRTKRAGRRVAARTCARRTTSCFSKARASTGWRRSSRSCTREPAVTTLTVTRPEAPAGCALYPCARVWCVRATISTDWLPPRSAASRVPVT